MELTLLIFLIIAIVSLVSIKKQQKKKDARLNRTHYNSHKDYLDDVKAATKKRFEEEAAQQAYKNNIKKDYLG